MRLKISFACLKGRGTTLNRHCARCARAYVNVCAYTNAYLRACVCVRAYVGSEENTKTYDAANVGRSRRGPLWQKNAGDKIAQPLHRRNPSLRVAQSPHCTLARLCQCTRAVPCRYKRPKAKAKPTLKRQKPINAYMRV